MTPTRMDRWLPWALAAGMFGLLLLGVTWDTAFEGLPPNTENVSMGASRIRDLKLETRERAEEEHCFGSGGGSGCTTDSGFHREGSGRVFYATAVPAVLLNPVASALGANDDGRVFIDSDGPDGAGATYDDETVFGWSGAAFAVLRAAQPTIVDSATVNDAQLLDIATLDTAPSNLALTGGSSGGNPAITTPAAGTWDIVTAGHFVASLEADGVAEPDDSVTAFFRLQEQIGAGAFATVDWCMVLILQDTQLEATSAWDCHFNYVRRSAAVSTLFTYRFRVSTSSNSNTGGDLRIDATAAGDQTEGESPNDGFLTVEAVRR